MTIAVFEFTDKAPEEIFDRRGLGHCRFLHPHVKWYQGDSMEVFNSLAAILSCARAAPRTQAFARGGLHLDALTLFGEPK